MNKIFITGSSGSGKSTLAYQISNILLIKAIGLDQIFWKPGWISRTKNECHEILNDIVKNKSWIIEGNADYKGERGTYDLIMAAADTILFLDFPQHICWWRTIKRQLQYKGKYRPDLSPEYPERLTRTFLIKLWNYHQDERPLILKKIMNFSRGKNVIILSSNSEVKSFISLIEQEYVNYDD